MSKSTLDDHADRLIAEAIAAGRLSPKPSLESLNRVARIIAPVLASRPVTVAVTANQKAPEEGGVMPTRICAKKTARAWTTRAVRQEGRHRELTTTTKHSL